MSPMKAPKNCSYGRCPNLVPLGTKYCEAHKGQLRKDYPRRHPERQKMYGAQWQKVRKMHLARNPMCVIEGCNQAATECDHIVDHKGDWDKFYDPNNLQSLCKQHHNEKTGREYIFGKGEDKK